MQQTIEPILKSFAAKDRRALARLLTHVARGEHLEQIRASLRPIPADRRTIAFTGSAGVGKSSLIGKLIELYRSLGKTVAVLACDPQSPLTGGALLGDRFRMPARPEDEGIFIRSLATAEGQGAIAEHVGLMIQLLAAFGFDRILVETVGAGQGDTVVRRHADLVVLLLQPESGDDIQWEKAGLLEVADLIVIHKADLPGADRVESQVRELLNLPGCRPVPVMRASSTTGVGLAELRLELDQLPVRTTPGPALQDLLERATELLAHRFRLGQALLEPVLRRWRAGELSDDAAAALVLGALAGGSAPLSVP